MYTGKIKKVVRDRGFGFISATDGREIFFHRNSFSNVRFDSVNEGQEVEFDVEKSPKGLNAVNIRVAE